MKIFDKPILNSLNNPSVKSQECFMKIFDKRYRKRILNSPNNPSGKSQECHIIQAIHSNYVARGCPTCDELWSGFFRTVNWDPLLKNFLNDMHTFKFFINGGIEI